MTDEDRRYVDLLAYNYKMTHNWSQREQDAFVEGFNACAEKMRESSLAECGEKRALVEDVEREMHEVERERARSAKLVQALKWYARFDNEGNDGEQACNLGDKAREALMKYEACRD